MKIDDFREKAHNYTKHYDYIQTSQQSIDWGSNLPARNTNFKVRRANHYTTQGSSNG